MQPTPPIRSDRPGASLLGDLLGSPRAPEAEVADLAHLMRPEAEDLVLRELAERPAGVVPEQRGVAGDESAPGLLGE